MDTTEPKTDEGVPNRTDLDGRYREIGIPAVAAAVRYQSDRKNPAYAPIPADARFAVDAPPDTASRRRTLGSLRSRSSA